MSMIDDRDTASIRAAIQNAPRLEALVEKLVKEIHNITSDSEGRFPVASAGCLHCTSGTTPDRWNTGLCALHEAEAFLAYLKRSRKK